MGQAKTVAMRKIAKMGRRGDTELVHVNKAEKRMLKRAGGSGTRNPRTGLREYWQGEGDTNYGFGEGVTPGGQHGRSRGSDGRFSTIGATHPGRGAGWASALGGPLVGAAQALAGKKPRSRERLQGKTWGDRAIDQGIWGGITRSGANPERAFKEYLDAWNRNHPSSRTTRDPMRGGATLRPASGPPSRKVTRGGVSSGEGGGLLRGGGNNKTGGGSNQGIARAAVRASRNVKVDPAHAQHADKPGYAQKAQKDATRQILRSPGVKAQVRKANNQNARTTLKDKQAAARQKVHAAARKGTITKAQANRRLTNVKANQKAARQRVAAKQRKR